MIRGGQIEHEVLYHHPRERVWHALVDAAELGAWLMPTDFVPEVGRRFTFDARPDLGFVTGEVLEVDPPRLLRCRWSGVFGDTLVSFELTPAADGTLLRLRHSGWQEAGREHLGGFDEGWHSKLNKDLAAVLGARPDSHEPPPHQPARSAVTGPDATTREQERPLR